jgi:hypothetical protein
MSAKRVGIIGAVAMCVHQKEVSVLQHLHLTRLEHVVYLVMSSSMQHNIPASLAIVQHMSPCKTKASVRSASILIQQKA